MDSTNQSATPADPGFESHSQPIPTEVTPLLHNNHGFPFHNPQHHSNGFLESPDETFSDGELEDPIDQNEFDLMLSKSNSYTSGIGMAPESQEHPMLRGHQNHSKTL